RRAQAVSGPRLVAREDPLVRGRRPRGLETERAHRSFERWALLPRSQPLPSLRAAHPCCSRTRVRVSSPIGGTKPCQGRKNPASRRETIGTGLILSLDALSSSA